MIGHVLPVKVYVAICAILLLLTALTVWVAFVDLGPLNTVAALAIAGCKASLVILYFMHARYSGRLVQASILMALLFLGVLLALTLADYMSRSWLPTPGA